MSLPKPAAVAPSSTETSLRKREYFLKGRAPADHPRACQAKTHGKPCYRWALKGSRYCQRHGGRRSPVNVRGKFRMHSYYSQQLGGTLGDKLAELASRPHNEQVQIYEEIGIARLMLLDALKLARPVLDNDPKVTDTLRGMVRELLTQGVSQVASLCETASRIERNAEDKISLTVLQLFVTQVTRAIYEVLSQMLTPMIVEVLGDVASPTVIEGRVGELHLRVAERLNERIQQEVCMPKDSNRRLDESMHVRILHNTLPEIASAMDAVTSPSGAAAIVAQSGSVQGGECGATIRQDRVGEATADPGTD